MGGVSPAFSAFVGVTCVTLLSVLAGESFGLCIGASVFDLQKGMTIMTVLALSLMLVGGFFVQNVPSFVQWVKYLSPFKYAFDTSQRLIFDRPVPCDGSGALEELCNGEATGSATPDEILEFLDVQGSVAFNVGILFALILVPRLIAYAALRSNKENERS